MKDVLVLYPHGLGDCILLTPAIREFYKATGHKLHIATLERFKTAQFFTNNPYVDQVFYTKDAWHDYSSSQIGFAELYKEWKSFAVENNFGGFVMPMHSQPVSKIELNLKFLGLQNCQEYQAEIHTTSDDVNKANDIVFELTKGNPFGFIQTNTGVKQKDLPAGFGQDWLRNNKNLNNFIEVGVDFSPYEYNINVQFEIMRLATAVCVPDSVFYHACHAIGKPIDFAYFGRGKSVYERVKHTIASEENIVYNLESYNEQNR